MRLFKVSPLVKGFWRLRAGSPNKNPNYLLHPLIRVVVPEFTERIVVKSRAMEQGFKSKLV